MQAVYPGSFDPPTLGHLDIIKRGADMFNKLYIAILINPAKTPLFTTEERQLMLQEEVKNFPNIKVLKHNGLLAEFAKEHNISYILRGLRNESDCAYELPMAQANYQLGNGLETIMLASKPTQSYMSATLIREIAAAAHPAGFDDTVLNKWLSPVVLARLRLKFSNNIGG